MENKKYIKKGFNKNSIGQKFQKGHIPWYKLQNKPHPCKGKIAWNKGLKGVCGAGKKRRPHTKEEIKKISISLMGNKNPNWKGGKWLEVYPQEFNNKLKEQIRKRDNHRCQECFRHQDELRKKLQVHHIDYNKKNNNLNNLISLCSVCHGQTNFKRENWINYFQNQLEIGGKNNGNI